MLLCSFQGSGAVRPHQSSLHYPLSFCQLLFHFLSNNHSFFIYWFPLRCYGAFIITWINYYFFIQSKTAFVIVKTAHFYPRLTLRKSFIYKGSYYEKNILKSIKESKLRRRKTQ